MMGLHVKENVITAKAGIQDAPLPLIFQGLIEIGKIGVGFSIPHKIENRSPRTKTRILHLTC